MAGTYSACFLYIAHIVHVDQRKAFAYINKEQDMESLKPFMAKSIRFIYNLLVVQCTSSYRTV